MSLRQFLEALNLDRPEYDYGRDSTAWFRRWRSPEEDGELLRLLDAAIATATKAGVLGIVGPLINRLFEAAVDLLAKLDCDAVESYYQTWARWSFEPHKHNYRLTACSQCCRRVAELPAIEGDDPDGPFSPLAIEGDDPDGSFAPRFVVRDFEDAKAPICGECAKAFHDALSVVYDAWGKLRPFAGIDDAFSAASAGAEVDTAAADGARSVEAVNTDGLEAFKSADWLDYHKGIRPERVSAAAGDGKVAQRIPPRGYSDHEGNAPRVLYHVKQAEAACAPKRRGAPRPV